MVTARGHIYAYYRRDGLRQRIRGEVGSEEWQAEYNRIHKSFEQGPAEPGINPGSLADLIALFKKSSDFAALKPSTRQSYARYMDLLREKYGAHKIRSMPREFVLELRDKHAEMPRKANYIISILRVLLAYALDRPSRFGIEFNPAVKIKKLETGPGYPPWPDGLMAAVWDEEKCIPELRLAIATGAFTGQRISDCIAVTWKNYDGQQINLVQQKTGVELTIPVHPDLKSMFKGVPRKAVQILVDPRGRPWTRFALGKAVREFVTAAEYPGYSFHGLRKLASKNLAETGCTEDEIKAITGHQTSAMVSHYTKGANQKRLAKSAIKKLSKGRRKT